MSLEFVAPVYDQPAWTAAQVAYILIRPRVTLGGWIMRYKWLGVSEVVAGSTRLFSAAEIGRLVALRQAIGANFVDGLRDNFSEIEPAIDQEFGRLSEGFEIEEYCGKPAPHFARLSDPLLLRGRERFLHPTRSTSSGAYVADSAGYQLTDTVIHLGQCLRTAWLRAMLLQNGIALAE